MKTRRFVDRVTVRVRAGKGGDGSASFRREKYVPRGGPDGGDGGRGGHVYLRGSKDTDSLVRLYFEPEVIAEPGQPGRGQQMTGRTGRDLIVDVPLGTICRDRATHELYADITTDGQLALIARGGAGGLGNIHFKSATHQAPTEHTPGAAGQEFECELELRTLADIGLIGFPSAGKSSLLAALTAARPKIGAYPFTTLNPIVGTLIYDDHTRHRIADIPGIIAGAAQGVGLGLEFLRHIARAHLLVVVLDMAGSEGRQPLDDYQILRAELKAYDPTLLKRPWLIVANKMDLPQAEENLKAFRQKVRRRVLPISAAAGRGLSELRAALQAALPCR